MKTGLIYKYTNKINNKIYIGQTTQQLEIRDKKHYYDKNNTYFDRAYKKYGRDNFILEILEDNIPIEDLDKKEIQYIKEYDSLYCSKKGYNMTKGGKWGCSHQKISGDIEKQIKELLQTTNKSFKDISKETGINYYSISDINRGRVLFDSNLNYPLRKTMTKTIIAEDNFEKILDLLINSKKSINEISKDFNVSEYTIGQINRGKSKTYYKDGISYPIRKGSKESTYNAKLTSQNVIDICKDLILSNKTQSDIAKTYGIKKNTINDISRGISWKNITHDFIFPIRLNKDKNKEVLNNFIG